MDTTAMPNTDAALNETVQMSSEENHPLDLPCRKLLFNCGVCSHLLTTQSVSAWEYTQIVSRHAQRSTHHSFFPGQNFEDLACRLRKALLRRQGMINISYMPNSTSLATLCTLNASVKYNDSLNDVNQARKLLEVGSELGAPHILFLKGNPSPEWMAIIGSSCRVDPEFFLRHLSFGCRYDYFSLPQLPSCSDNIITLPYVTLCSREDRKGQGNQGAINDLRIDGEKAMEIYTHQLKVDATVGDSIVRKYFIHDEMHFSLEQEMTISLNQLGESWVILVAMDTGRALDESLEGPWLAGVDHQSPWKIRVYPTIQAWPGVVLQSDNLASNYKDNKAGRFPQSASLLDQDYGKLLDIETMRHDPFYALHELFAFCASSELQFLNMMDSKISAETGYTKTGRTPTLSNLLYHHGILQSHAVRLGNILDCIQRRGSLDWPRSFATEEQRQISDAAADKLARDYAHLLHHAESLLRQCEKGMQVVMGQASIREMEMALAQSGRVARLTQLAFFYIPFSFMASFFGMNFEELGTGKLHIWCWFAAAIPVFLVSVLFLVADFPAIFFRLRNCSPPFFDSLRRRRF